MNVRDLVILLKNARLIIDSEDEDLLIDIVERYMDQKSQYKTTRDNCLVKRPILMELQDEKSIDLDSSFHEEGKTVVNSVVVSANLPIQPGNNQN